MTYTINFSGSSYRSREYQVEAPTLANALYELKQAVHQACSEETYILRDSDEKVSDPYLDGDTYKFDTGDETMFQGYITHQGSTVKLDDYMLGATTYCLFEQANDGSGEWIGRMSNSYFNDIERQLFEDAKGQSIQKEGPYYRYGDTRVVLFVCYQDGPDSIQGFDEAIKNEQFIFVHDDLIEYHNDMVNKDFKESLENLDALKL